MQKTIFVVDDVSTNLVAAEQTLEDYYNVLTIQSGKKAIAILEKIVPHLILLDIYMPEMDGFEVMHYLQNHRKFKNIPVVFLTGTEDAQLEAKCYEMGANGFIRKPFSETELLSCVRLHVDNISNDN